MLALEIKGICMAGRDVVGHFREVGKGTNVSVLGLQAIKRRSLLYN